MNIQSNPSPSFKATLMSEKLSTSQRYNAKSVINWLKNTREYEYLGFKKVDVCFLKPGRDNEGLRVRYYDNNNGTFVRNSKGSILETVVSAVQEFNYNQLKRSMNKINEDLFGITHGMYQAPDWSKNPSKYAEEGRRIFESHNLE